MPDPNDILLKYGITPPEQGGYAKFSVPSGTYPGRSYNSFANAYAVGAQQYADALNQAKASGTATTAGVPSVPTTGVSTAIPAGTYPVAVPSAGIETPQLNYTPQNNAEYITSMANLINQINQDAQRSANAGRIPGATGLEAQSSKNISSALQGILPQDVQYQLAQKAAERGVGRGSPLGASTTADLMRALGLTSLQLQGTGQEWLNSAYARNPAAPIYDASQLLITPLQASQFGLQQGQFQLSKAQLDTQAQLDRERQQLQRELANASNQLDRERINAQLRDNELQRQNALRIAQLGAQSRASSGSPYGYNAYPSGGYQSATNGLPSFNWNDLFPQQPTQTQQVPTGQWTPGTVTNPSSPDFGYTTLQGYPNTNPSTYSWDIPTTDSWGTLLPEMNWGTNPQYDYNFGEGDINSTLYGGF